MKRSQTISPQWSHSTPWVDYYPIQQKKYLTYQHLEFKFQQLGLKRPAFGIYEIDPMSIIDKTLCTEQT